MECRFPSSQAAAAGFFVAVNLGILLVAGAVLTESAWDGLTYGNTWDGKGMSVGTDEYEACERVRRTSGVRARSNAYSSAFYLGAPTFQLASNGFLSEFHQKIKMHILCIPLLFAFSCTSFFVFIRRLLFRPSVHAVHACALA